MRAAALALAALALAALAPAAASAAKLRSTTYGAVDLGDRIAFRVTGKGCERVAVSVRINAGPERRAVTGRAATPVRAPDGGCAGIARVPDFHALRTTGWQPGDQVRIALVSRAGKVPLRFARMEPDQGIPAAGSPAIVPSGDAEAGPRDRAVELDPGDAIDVGRVDLRRADGLALRLCVEGEDTSTAPPNLGPLLTPQRSELPAWLSVRQDGPNGPALVGPIDVSAGPQEISRLSTLGFDGCYRLVVLPITGRRQEDAPKLFVRGEDRTRTTLRITSVDVTGSGARLPPQPPTALRGMRTIFNGRSFAGWDHEHCVLRDGAAVNARSGDDNDTSACSMTYRTPLRDVVVRLRLRRENIYDNAGVYLGEQEIQMRSVGEYLPGGYFGQMAARWQKLSVFPDYDEIEIVQLGARHVVTVNGRTVTDVMRRGGPPEPYRLNLIAQPQWSYRTGTETGFGNEGFPDTVKPSELGAFWFKEVRLLRCTGPDDPVCRRAADARRGQVPVPDGAPPPLGPDRAPARR